MGQQRTDWSIPADKPITDTDGVDRSITAAGLVLGIVIGFVGGIAFAVARRAWVDVGKAKTQLGGAKKIAWTVTRVATTRVGFVGLLVVAAIAWAAVGPR
jgi:hypothetical protein